ncbi:acetyl-CoA carboxylase biotin carboxylase subunit family protein [Burkholderia sp. 22PA0099]|uniref:ATP-grasp domain-containing protein n=1 Tax=Burkholderia sp. 22PA0099 TaxID=3237372 RepID=UPI0039C1F3A5
MILLLLSPRTAHLDYSAWLHDCADELIAVAPHDAEVAAGFHEIARVEHYADDAEVLAAARSLMQRHTIRRIVALAEVDIERAALLRAELNLPGQSPDSARAYRDKVVMKRHLLGSPVRVPQFAPVETVADIVEFMARCPGTVVLKPRSASGSTGVVLVEQPSDLEGLALPLDTVAYEAEAFIAGDFFHVDLLKIDGERIFAIPSAYTGEGCLAHWTDSGSGSYTLARDDWRHAALVAASWAVVDALPATSDLIAHAEFFITPERDIVFCEIASRVAGTPIPTMLQRCLGLDPRELWCRIACGLPVDLAGIRAALDASPLVANFGLPPRNGVVRGLPADTLPGIESLQILVTLGDDWSGQRYEARKSGDFVATWLVTGQDEPALLARLSDSCALMESAVTWAESS